MTAARRLPHALLGACTGLALAVGGCYVTHGIGARGPMRYAGPAGWQSRFLKDPPPYGLAQYVEPLAPGVPETARGFVLVGKARMQAGRAALGGACEEQWRSEQATPAPPTGRRNIRLSRSGAEFTGWEATRRLQDGTAMRLRTLCGTFRQEFTFLYLSAPDRSRLYEPVWEALFEINTGVEARR